MKLFLLPTVFKKVGIVLFILTFIISILCMQIDFTYKADLKDPLKQFLISLFCLSLFFLNFYKHETESKKLQQIRLQCLVITFLFVIKYIVIVSALNALNSDGIPFTANEMIFLILLLNLCMMLGMTRKVKRVDDMEAIDNENIQK